MPKNINDMVVIDGVLVFSSENSLKNGMFGYRLDIEYVDETDLIEMVDDTLSLEL